MSDITHRELGSPKSIISQANAPQSCLQVNLMEIFFSTEVFFLNTLPDDLALVKLTRKITGTVMFKTVRKKKTTLLMRTKKLQFL